MVGVDEVGIRPAEGARRGVGLGADVGGPRADDRVLAVGLVPDGGDRDAEIAGADEGRELGPPLAGEAVADAEAVTGEIHGKFLDASGANSDKN